MPATVTSLTPRRAADPGHPPPTGEPPRRPFRDNPRLILAGIGVLVVVTMDFWAQVQSYVMSQQYESLLKKANFKAG